uniref:Putative secreted protein n=1 Tax=Panstrongylus lignarius TaxID=156445 RepID=A0A224Y0C1_9HEMI
MKILHVLIMIKVIIKAIHFHRKLVRVHRLHRINNCLRTIPPLEHVAAKLPLRSTQTAPTVSSLLRRLTSFTQPFSRFSTFLLYFLCNRNILSVSRIFDETVSPACSATLRAPFPTIKQGETL